MIPGKATVKRKSPEAASMSRWGQTHRWGAKSNKSMLHEWHQVTHLSSVSDWLQFILKEFVWIPGYDATGLWTLNRAVP